MGQFDDSILINPGINPYAEYNGHRVRFSTMEERLKKEGFFVEEVEGFTDENMQPLPGDSGMWKTKRKVAVDPMATVYCGPFTENTIGAYEFHTRRWYWIEVYFSRVADKYPSEDVGNQSWEEPHDLTLTGKEVLVEETPQDA